MVKMLEALNLARLLHLYRQVDKNCARTQRARNSWHCKQKRARNS
jgi:hypothetical protein